MMIALTATVDFEEDGEKINNHELMMDDDDG